MNFGLGFPTREDTCIRVVIFRPWEGTWDGTARTTSCAQNSENFAAFAGISEIWPLTEERLRPFYLTRGFKYFHLIKSQDIGSKSH